MDEDLAYHLQEIAKLAETNPKEANEAMRDILGYVYDRKRFAEEIALQTTEEKEGGGKHV
ncbi:hypothetical protein NHP190002_12360 [Helicobacter ailurogastricus]|nr:hypothetical protein NHP190002_12360 [Helicobacter ailurogastricus]